eukprot:1156904-Pelagomonas_calceolata.AAC.1
MILVTHPALVDSCTHTQRSGKQRSNSGCPLPGQWLHHTQGCPHHHYARSADCPGRGGHRKSSAVQRWVALCCCLHHRLAQPVDCPGHGGYPKAQLSTWLQIKGKWAGSRGMSKWSIRHQ